VASPGSTGCVTTAAVLGEIEVDAVAVEVHDVIRTFGPGRGVQDPDQLGVRRRSQHVQLQAADLLLSLPSN
jgi:hypothetical protein